MNVIAPTRIVTRYKVAAVFVKSVDTWFTRSFRGSVVQAMVSLSAGFANDDRSVSLCKLGFYDVPAITPDFSSFDFPLRPFCDASARSFVARSLKLRTCEQFVVFAELGDRKRISSVFHRAACDIGEIIRAMKLYDL